jgi:SAM-dependent methyltransferase
MSFDEAALYSGLATLHWGSYDDPGWDHDFYRRVVEENTAPALDVGCGGGRLLRSYLRAGLAVEGCDISAEMLATCRANAKREGLAPTLYHQPMQELDLPKRYGAIYVPCGSLMCVMGRQNAIEALRRFREHLRPGGTLAFNIYLPDHDYSGKSAPPHPVGQWYRHHEIDFGDGRRLAIERRVTAVDPIEQFESEERHFKFFEGEHLAREEIRPGQSHWYFKHEMLLMLQLAGFSNVAVKGDYTDEDFGPQHTGTMVFIARKA